MVGTTLSPQAEDIISAWETSLEALDLDVGGVELRILGQDLVDLGGQRIIRPASAERPGSHP
jgi:hypothetical protein